MRRGRGMWGFSRLTLIQLALFLVAAIGCTAYVGVRVLGAQPLGGTIRVTVQMADTGGLTPSSEVTYRGVSVGTVKAIRIEPGAGGVSAELAIENEARVPASSRAVVSQENAMAIIKLDLRPDNENQPFFAEGDTIPSDRTSSPLPMETLLVNVMRLADSVDTRDLMTVADELSAGLSGSTTDLRRIMDSAGTLLDTMRQNRPVITSLVDNGKRIMSTMDKTGVSLPEVTASLRGLTGEVRGQLPAIGTLLDRAPAVSEQVGSLLRNGSPVVSALLANGVSASQILAMRTPALDHLLVAAPAFFGKMGSTVHGGVGDFYLVGAQGPVCYYDTARRIPTDTAPDAPNTEAGCRGDTPGLQQRGAANVPRPETAEPVAVTSYDPAAGDLALPGGQRAAVGSTAGATEALGSRSWYGLILQGVH